MSEGQHRIWFALTLAALLGLSLLQPALERPHGGAPRGAAQVRGFDDLSHFVDNVPR